MAGGGWEGDQNGGRKGKIAKFWKNITNISTENGRTKLKRYSGEARHRVLSECQLIILILDGGGGKKAEKRQNAWGLDPADHWCEAMPYNHQKWYGLENLTEGSLYKGECAIKILWRAEHGKVIKMELERAKSRNLGRISLISMRVLIIRN